MNSREFLLPYECQSKSTSKLFCFPKPAMENKWRFIVRQSKIVTIHWTWTIRTPAALPESEEHFGSIFKTFLYQNFTCVSNIFFGALRLVQKRDNIDLVNQPLLVFHFSILLIRWTQAQIMKKLKKRTSFSSLLVRAQNADWVRWMKKCSGGRMEVFSERVPRWCWKNW